ncbi:MAG: TraI/MobA(P) family conjugative relaxase [Nitrosospira sp.]
MIAKHLAMKVAKKSNFSELVKYIVNSQNKHERIECITVTNCHEIDHTHAIDEITAIQRQNKRAESDKTYHLLISFPASESPAIETLRQMESKVCESLGFAEHQRISAVHTDTDNLHMHIAINKIHTQRLTIHNPYCDHKILGLICDKLEIEYGLTRVNHQATNRGAQSQAFSMEAAGGVESLMGWIRRECLTELRTAGNWQEFHDVLKQNGLAIDEKGNGFLITDGQGRQVKPSSIARDLSRSQLEEKFGAFAQSSMTPRQAEKAYQPAPMASTQDTTNLYAAYQVARNQVDGLRAQNVIKARNKKNALIEAAKSEALQKRNAIKLFTQGALNRKILYHHAHKTLKDRIQTIKQQYGDECKAIRASAQRSSWLDWLQKNALAGDAEALSALRARKLCYSLNGNRFTGSTDNSKMQITGLKSESITKHGTVIYRAGASAIRDDGHQITVSKIITQKALALSLILAIHRFGPSLKVEGTAEFKEQVVQFAASAKLPVTFENPAMEKHRQSLISELPIQEKKHELHHRYGLADRTHEFGRKIRVKQRNQRRHGGLRKPDVARVGTWPPPQSKNRLRDLHELSMVHNSFGTELLLPSDVSRNVEQHQSQAIDGLRRKIPQPRRTVTQAGEMAAKQYIAEREEKRTYIKEIPKHTLWISGKSIRAEYAGWREKDGESLLLLRSWNNEIIVVSVDTATLERTKKLRMNEKIIFNEDGLIQKRGHHL